MNNANKSFPTRGLSLSSPPENLRYKSFHSLDSIFMRESSIQPTFQNRLFFLLDKALSLVFKESFYKLLKINRDQRGFHIFQHNRPFTKTKYLNEVYEFIFGFHGAYISQAAEANKNGRTGSP